MIKWYRVILPSSGVCAGFSYDTTQAKVMKVAPYLRFMSGMKIRDIVKHVKKSGGKIEWIP